MEFKLKFNLIGKNRREIREELINIFLQEEPGSNYEDNSAKYIYYVEILSNGKRVFLKRPAFLNKGMDFTIHLENTFFREKGANKDKPSHSEIIEDLLGKKYENPVEYMKVRDIINKLFNCQDVSQIEFTSIKFNTGIEIEGILKIIKWLFIEQDITYWNFSGRNKLYGGLVANDLV